MRLLLDTHIALWAIAASPGLSSTVADMISNPANTIVVSAASVWEISIKHALNRGGPSDMPISGATALSYFRAAGYELLSISAEHAAVVQTLPDLHRDPFGRILVAQALHEPLRLITNDAQVAAYSDQIMLV